MRSGRLVSLGAGEDSLLGRGRRARGWSGRWPGGGRRGRCSARGGSASAV